MSIINSPGFPKQGEIIERVSQLHASPYLVCSACAGAGLADFLWSAPGSTNTILDCRYLGPKGLTDAFLGFAPDQYVSEATAIALAERAYAEGRKLAIASGKSDRPVIGLGLTAAVRTKEPKKCDHRVHIVAVTEAERCTMSAVFEKGFLSREEEDALCDIWALNMILNAALIEQLQCPNHSVRSDEFVHSGERVLAICPKQIGRPAEFRRQLLELPVCRSDGFRARAEDIDPVRYFLVPTSANPRHTGHDALAEAIEQRTGMQAVFNITIGHVDKGPLDPDDLLRRIAQFAWYRSVFVCESTLYIDRARRFPGIAFGVGADVALKILDPKYYGGPEGLRDVLAEFRRLGTKFSVSDRVMGGERLSIRTMAFPPEAEGLFEYVELPEAVLTLSSSALRAAKGV